MLRGRSLPEPVRRFDWQDMRRYWEQHQDLRARADLRVDPHAHGNVCSFGAPAWLNEHYAAGQKAVFDRLLARIPKSGGRALDIGCGGARWSERLSDLGWEVTGIDLQEALIENNRRRLPHIHFQRVSLQEFKPDEPFTLVCSVTVLAHVPHEDQPSVLEKLHAITVPRARVLLLENILDQAPHVFANSVAGWTRLFRDTGFTREAVILYDYNPCTRCLAGLRGFAGRVLRRSSGGVRLQPDQYMVPQERAAAPLRTASEMVYSGLLRVVGAADRRLDPWLTSRGSAIPPPVHAGLIFVRT